MNHDHDHTPVTGPIAAPPFWRSRYALGLLVFGAIAAYFLLSEHRGHFFGALPVLLLLACPLMHMFMHHGHGGYARPPNRPDGDQVAITSAASGGAKTEHQS